MSLHTWDFWATQLSVVSKAALLQHLDVVIFFFLIQTVVLLNRLHKVPKLFESHQPQQTALLTTDHVHCIATKKNNTSALRYKTHCMSPHISWIKHFIWSDLINITGRSEMKWNKITVDCSREAEPQLQLRCLLQRPGWAFNQPVKPPFLKNINPYSHEATAHTYLFILFGSRCILLAPAFSKWLQQDKCVLYLVPGEFVCTQFTVHSASVDYESTEIICSQIKEETTQPSNCSLGSTWVFSSFQPQN